MSTLRNAQGVMPSNLSCNSTVILRATWEDEMEVHDIVQGEKGEQGDPPKPALFALGQYETLQAISRGLLPSEKLFSFLDDIFIVAAPERLAAQAGGDSFVGPHTDRHRPREATGLTSATPTFCLSASSRKFPNLPSRRCRRPRGSQWLLGSLRLWRKLLRALL